ncbi:hypothetical protein [Carboxylicivirga sp. M1479]|uniref:hypothetical protein n=1 Tax=Carboxylicivirga sp. M1479 TaxID=2594476 RepID=UPI00117806B6|nr:hypothetical protein [Carboxylicivirga sp. M1479]TRX71883.1 hypothetical protein FNN09_04485 [Carboxylicivirga sp. M1479]
MKTIQLKTITLFGLLSLLLVSLAGAQNVTLKLPLEPINNEMGYQLPIAGSKAKSTVKNKLAGIKIKEGQQLSFIFKVTKVSKSQTESRSCVADAGFIVDGCSFIIQNNKKDLRIYAGYGGLEKAPYYVLNRFAEDISVKVHIQKNNNGFTWAAETPIKTWGGKISKKKEAVTGVKFVYTPVKGKDQAYFVAQSQIGKERMPEFDEAELHPLLKYESTAVSKYDWDEPAAKQLVYDKSSRTLSDAELDGMHKYLLAYQLPTHNYMNYYFRKRMNSYMMEWVYGKKEDKALLDKAVDVAKCAIRYRNDNFGKYPISYSRTPAPLWPNYKEVEVYDDGTVGLVPGASTFAGLPSITVPIRMIANNPSVWQDKINGETYYEVALRLIDEALKTIDYTYDVFVGDDYLIRYPETLMRTAWHGKVYIYNRVFPVLTGSIPLIEALEKLKLYPEKVAQMDKVNQAMVNYLIKDMTYFGDAGQYVKYPYSQAAQEKNPDKEQVEDFMHGSFDSRDFQLFYASGRYGFDEKIIKAMANTLVEKVADGNGRFSERMNGSAKMKRFATPISYDGFIWYAAYRPEVYDLIVSHIISEQIAVKNGAWDAFCLYEILKLKDNE